MDELPNNEYRITALPSNELTNNVLPLYRVTIYRINVPFPCVDEKPFLRYNSVAGTLRFAEVVQEDFFNRMASCQGYQRNTPPDLEALGCIQKHQPSFLCICMYSIRNDSNLLKREEVRET